MEITGPDYLAPKQFTLEGLDDFSCACVSAEFCFHLGHACCLRSACDCAFSCVARESEALGKMT